MQSAKKALARLCECAGSPVVSLLAYAIVSKSHALAYEIWPKPSSTSLLLVQSAKKALARLSECAGSPVVSLLAYAISI